VGDRRTICDWLHPGNHGELLVMIYSSILDTIGRTPIVRINRLAPPAVTMYVKDFAHNGFLQQILSYSNNGKRYPLALRDELVRSIPSLRIACCTDHDVKSRFQLAKTEPPTMPSIDPEPSARSCPLMPLGLPSGM